MTSKALGNVFKLATIIDVNEPRFAGVDFGAKLQAAHDALPASGGIIDCTGVQGVQAVATSITITKRCRILLGGITIALGTRQIWIRCSAVSIIGMGKQDENNSPTLITYAGTSNAIELKDAATATPLFGIVLENLEVAATGGAGTSATAVGIASYGTRYCEFRNVQVFNFAAGKGMYFTGNGAVVNGFGATNIITNPALSTNKYGIVADAAGGSHSTHGLVYGGYAFGSTTGFDVQSESWRVFGTDLGGTPCVKIRAGADDTCLFGPRFEAYTQGVTIDATVSRTQIIAPSFIDSGPGTEITDDGTDSVIVGSIPGFDSKVIGLRAKSVYSSNGVTANLAALASEDVLDMSAGGVWLVGVTQSDGGTVWRASAIVYSSGVALTITSISSNNVTVTSNGAAVLRLTNSSGALAQALSWSVVKFMGAAQ